MTYGFVFPEIRSKDLTPEKKKQRLTITGKPVRGKTTRKYDHEGMIKDRLSGMAWKDIAEKHNVRHGPKDAGLRAWRTVMSSSSCAMLTPEQVRRLGEVGYCRAVKP